MPVTVSTPASSPASLPTFSGVDVETATSSNRSSAMSWRSVSLPALPVLTWATRIDM